MMEALVFAGWDIAPHPRTGRASVHRWADAGRRDLWPSTPPAVLAILGGSPTKDSACACFRSSSTLAVALAGAPVQAQQSPPPIRIDDTMVPLAAPLPDAARMARFDAFVAAVQKQFDVPGVAVAIVKDGQVVLERGYGVREARQAREGRRAHHVRHRLQHQGVHRGGAEHAAGRGQAEDQDRVIDHLPWFRMSDPYVTREMRIRDLLAHRSGLSLGAGDLLYWPTTTYSHREVAERLRDVPLTGGFREQYAYDNILFGVAQLVIEEASGMSYKQFLRPASSSRWACARPATTATTSSRATTSPPATPSSTSRTCSRSA
jgi:hypothetical protein